MKAICHLCGRSAAFAALLASATLAAGPATANDAIAPPAANMAAVQVEPDTPHVRELFGLYMLDLARLHCDPQEAAKRDNQFADAIFMAEVRSGLDARDLERLHAKAADMTVDPAFCSKAASLLRTEGDAG